MRGIDGLLRRIGSEHDGPLDLVLHSDKRASVLSLIESHGDDECDRLAGVVNLVVL